VFEPTHPDSGLEPVMTRGSACQAPHRYCGFTSAR
jgi:hypothetical protein